MARAQRHDHGWDGHIGQLSELLALVATHTDLADAAPQALAHALAILGAQAGSLGWGGVPLADAGHERCPSAVALALSSPTADDSAVSAERGWHVQHARLRSDDGWLAVAGSGAPSDGDGELLALTAGVLGAALAELALRGRERELREHRDHHAQENERLRNALRDRHALQERLGLIQRAIVLRASLQTVLDMVVVDAAELLAADVAHVLLIDRGDPERLMMAARHGWPLAAHEGAPQMPVSGGLAGRAIEAAACVATADYALQPWAWPELAAQGVRAAMAAPLRENGRIVGALFVARHAPGRPFRTADSDTLTALAEHTSLALSDAGNHDSAVHHASHDLLTGLANRTLFVERLEEAQRRVGRSGGAIAVLLLDLDRFKRVNDSLGHAVCDELLIEVAGRLEDCLRPTDTVARFGGDEFAILLEGLEREADATVVASRILLALHEPVERAGRRVTVSASIGVALGSAGDSDLMRDAGLAMYRAKEAGKNRCEVFDASMRAVAMDNLRLESQLQRAVEQDELVLHFQPIVSLASGAVEGVEALVRWQHPERGLLGPGEFIGVAEQTRVISALGRWVLNAACREALRWPSPAAGEAAVAVSVNLSVMQLRQPGLIYEVAEALARTGLEPSRLMLEVTETMLTDDVEQTAATLADLKRLGVQLAVDDFGTGYSSLQYLRLFPIDIIKIAKPFVDGVDGGDCRLARVILALGRSLRLRVIAEGIERPSQAQALRRLGCRWGQGYQYSRPLPAEELRELLAASAPAVAPGGLHAGAGDGRGIRASRLVPAAAR